MSDYSELDLELPGGVSTSVLANSDSNYDPAIGFQPNSPDVMRSPQAVWQFLQSDVAGTVRTGTGFPEETQTALNIIHQMGEIALNETMRLCNFMYANGTSFKTFPPCNDSNDITTEVAPDYTDSAALEKALSICVPILFGLIVVVGLFGNALVVIVVLCNPQMRSTTNLLIINLAIADLLFIVFCVPFTGWDYALPYWPFGDAWCRVVQYLIIVCAYASIYTLALMSLDRFLAVVHPIASMSVRTERNAYIAITCTWVVILVSCTPAILAHGEMSYTFSNTEYSVCIFLSTKGYNYAAFQIAFFLSSYIIPLALIFILYLLMLKRLWFGIAPGGHVSAESVRSKKRVTRLVVVVVVIFAVCWGPIQIILVLKSVEYYDLTESRWKIILQIASQVLAYTNSCINPILYALVSENFRKAFRKVIACSPKRNGGRARGCEYEKTERENAGSVATKTSKVFNDLL